MKKFSRILVFIFVLVAHFVSTKMYIWAHIVLYTTIGILSVLTIIEYLRNKRVSKINIADLLVLSFTLYLFLNNVFKGTFCNNIRLFDLLLLLFSYFILSVLYKKDRGIINYIFYGFLVGLSIELVIGFGQIFGVFSNDGSMFLLGGLFGNPGAFGGYLALIIPALLYVILQGKQLGKSENLHYAFIFCFATALCLLIVSNSRGAWVACLVGMVFVISKKYILITRFNNLFKTIRVKIILGVISLIIISFVCFSLYNYKKDSAFGRLFIWKVSSEMIYEHPIFGSGYASFEENYGKVQAAYFAGGRGSDNEKQVADYVTCAYNEYLEIFIESGIIGLLLFVGIIYTALRKTEQEEEFSHEVAAKASLFAFTILCFVSYPLSFIPNILILLLCLFIIFQSKKNVVCSVSKYAQIIGYVVILALIYQGGRYMLGCTYLKKGYAKVLDGNFDDGLKEYNQAAPFLHNDAEFQFFYGSALYLKHDYASSIPYLEKATNLSSDPNIFLTLGRSLEELKQYTKAESAYLTAVNITPSKLYPKYLLTKLYFEMRQTEKALAMAKIIMNTKEKIPTTAGKQIKEKINELMVAYNKKMLYL